MRQQPEGPEAKRQLVDLPQQVEELTPEEAEQTLGGTIVAVNGGGNTPAVKPTNRTMTFVDQLTPRPPSAGGSPCVLAVRQLRSPFRLSLYPRKSWHFPHADTHVAPGYCG